mmetsp:Transcript_22434/g.27022  ORF Transcript_22434/g.27022 Transcript_22434/m.27022 type:complete len:180 (-) Transcript_22434:2103-2642(-)
MHNYGIKWCFSPSKKSRHRGPSIKSKIATSIATRYESLATTLDPNDSLEADEQATHSLEIFSQILESDALFEGVSENEANTASHSLDKDHDPIAPDVELSDTEDPVIRSLVEKLAGCKSVKDFKHRGGTPEELLQAVEKKLVTFDPTTLQGEQLIQGMTASIPKERVFQPAIAPQRVEL